MGGPGSIPGKVRGQTPLKTDNFKAPLGYNNVFHIFGNPKPPTCKKTKFILQNNLFRVKIKKCCAIWCILNEKMIPSVQRTLEQSEQHLSTCALFLSTTIHLLVLSQILARNLDFASSFPLSNVTASLKLFPIGSDIENSTCLFPRAKKRNMYPCDH